MRADAVALMRWASRATGNHREPRVTGLVLREALKPTDEGSASTEGGGGGKEEGGAKARGGLRGSVGLKAGSRPRFRGDNEEEALPPSSPRRTTGGT